MMMNELFSLTPVGETCDITKLQTARQNIIEIQDGVYQTQLSMLSPKQKQLLQAIVQEGIIKSVTSAAFIKKYSLDGASSVQSAMKGLIEKALISTVDSQYHIEDYFFAEWLKKNY